MKKFSEQLHKKSQTVKLKAAERKDLRERIVSYMEYHPLPGSAKQAAATPSLYFTEQFIRVPFSRFIKGGAVVAALVLVLIPALAERAVPGDGLYAIKVSFNEEVRSTLAFSPYQKIEWETERLNRRIAEARLLASEGRLTEEVEAEVAEAVKQHTESAKREIETLRGQDEEEATLASIELNTTLEVQAETLDDSEEETEDGAERPTRLLATVVKEAAADEEVPPATPSYDRLMARVETNTTRVQELLASLELAETSEDYRDTTRRLEDINRTVEEAIATRDSDDEAARRLLVDALQRTQRLIVFMTEIQLDQEFELEDFVPIVLTPEEQAGQVTRFRVSATEQIESIETLIASSTDEATGEKATFGLDTLRDLNEQMNLSEDYFEIKGFYEEFTNLATSVTNLFDAATDEATPQDPIDAPDTTATSTGTSSDAEETPTGIDATSTEEELPTPARTERDATTTGETTS